MQVHDNILNRELEKTQKENYKMVYSTKGAHAIWCLSLPTSTWLSLGSNPGQGMNALCCPC